MKRYQVQMKGVFFNGLHVTWDTLASFGSHREAAAFLNGYRMASERGNELRIYDTKQEIVL